MTQANIPASLPPGACDTHFHIFDLARFPLPASATYQPPPATLAQYREAADLVGLQRMVIVQANGYGLDNRCTPDALKTADGQARAS